MNYDACIKGWVELPQATAGSEELVAIHNIFCARSVGTDEIELL